MYAAVESAYDETLLVVTMDGSTRKGNEQTIAFRVGIHFHEILKGSRFSAFDLDSEYNKHGDDAKKRSNGSSMRPDLLIHRRGNDDDNILAVEFSAFWQDESKIVRDRDKLIELTHPEYDYKYKLGVLVKLEDNRFNFEYFRLGQIER